MKGMIGLIALLPALAFAAGNADQASAPVEKPPAFGLSNNVVGHENRADQDDQVTRDTRRLLNQQANSKPADHSELSAPVYVETQQRLSRSFNKDIKDFSKDQTIQSGSQ